MMNKTMIVIALSILFQTAPHAGEQHTAERTDSAEPAEKIIMPKVGSQYNLNGMQSNDGSYKSSYSTKSLDHRDKKLQDQQTKQQQRFNERANNPNGAGLLIIVDE